MKLLLESLLMNSFDCLFFIFNIIISTKKLLKTVNLFYVEFVKLFKG